MQKLKLIVDTDIGDDIDDAFALALLFQMPEVEILGVTTVYRNAFLRAKIASHLAQLCGQNIPVYVGEDTPLNDPIEWFAFEKADADGKPLIGHYDDSMRHAPIARGNAADFILQQAERFPGQITVLALGPMTNLARAYFKAPETFRKIGRIHDGRRRVLSHAGVESSLRYRCGGSRICKRSSHNHDRLQRDERLPFQ